MNRRYFLSSSIAVGGFAILSKLPVTAMYRDAKTEMISGVAAVGPHPNPLPGGEGAKPVQTGNIVYRMNRAHGLHWVGKEEDADAVERNQCHGPENSVDS
jgi:hypothetical protein